MNLFREKVIKFVKKIPKGRVVSYGQLAAASGHPRAARQVGTILRTIDPAAENIPWWRVLNNQGIISIKGNWTATKELQRTLLKKEGVKVNEDYTLDIEKYRYNIN
jgi:methylated-DNA-protein-cysteine methyltransferase-like protein